MLGILRDFRYGRWQFGCGWWKEAEGLWFACSRDWIDGWWYGFRLGPFWACCSPT